VLAKRIQVIIERSLELFIVEFQKKFLANCTMHQYLILGLVFFHSPRFLLASNLGQQKNFKPEASQSWSVTAFSSNFGLDSFMTK
jgi:hypothetical protein